jgi:hypothetical protein
VSAVAVMLIAVGIADACRRLVRPVWVPVALAPIVVVACALLAALWHIGDVLLLVIAAAGSVGWVILCARAERTGAHQGAPLAVFAMTVALLQLVTGNQLVRLVLASVGAVKPAGQPQPSDRLKGGRLLGPMERLLILGLGLGGQLAAATAVVAAKSIIRFPELNAQKARENGDVGIDDVTEYFLVGSFASWILALAGLALAFSL